MRDLRTAPVDAATVQRCLRGLDKHNCNHFGVRACVQMELDGLHEPPSHAWCGGTRCLLPWPAVGKRTTFIAITVDGHDRTSVKARRQ